VGVPRVLRQVISRFAQYFTATIFIKLIASATEPLIHISSVISGISHYNLYRSPITPEYRSKMDIDGYFPFVLPHKPYVVNVHACTECGLGNPLPEECLKFWINHTDDIAACQALSQIRSK
jgi:hypothetical protein